MIASWARSATWAIGSQTKLWATFCVDRKSHQRRSGVARPPARWHRLLHGRSADLARLITYYILFFIEIGSRRVSLGGILTAPKVPEQV